MESAQLPGSYRERMQRLLGREYPDYLSSLQEPVSPALRVNTGKWSRGEARRVLPFPLDPVPWAADGYYIPEDAPASGHPAWYAGLYYLQEASAMSPGALFPLREGDRILDLCAAPGGKATQIAARMHGKGLLTANDISASRARALRKNLERAGVRNAFVTAETPERLAEEFPSYYDGVLVDAPCSGEGMFRRDPSLIRDWLSHGPSFYAPLQAQILDCAVQLLRPGGHLLYSTCTFSTEENEDNVRGLLARHPEMQQQSLPLFPGFSEGFLPGTVRIWPQRTRGEGHFLALFEKTASCPERETGRGEGHSGKKKKEKKKPFSLPPPLAEKIGGLLAGQKLIRREESLYALPEEAELSLRIRYLRTGLRLGEWKGERFVPSQALAMALRGEEYPDRVSFPWEDERAVRYLKGETVDADGADIRGEEGLCLVCLSDFPLGWAARRGTVLKNRLDPGWRWL